ncbi:hypothetical protein EMIHUDRAFT_193852 [Emiliania huxleyi CCMP1516]|uniref:Fungal lipase-type domain-containing protein n=2 Tax=Emiliania huxleyi TaxID=2903 RepID=A0A0D3L0I6_EMIH1|nr:hypothetical protein EMIHUDRAFT_193852 [Emiliania huxleyi CCMP1516]EOD41521.1 hypothetical protein EMIHUDRAFT_193852 [Emiliania huxleyi CCMP1516]|eukprot:XP_005793950.1 hypothetical protein EMIHUDRAFT_193852 [Emiliania huxleyi CCMP1516]
MRCVIGLFIALLPPSGAFAPHNVTACDGHAYHPGPATARGRLLTDPNQGCQPWSRDWETTSTFISQAALEAGRQSVKLMYAAYLFEYSEKATVGIHAEAAQAKQTLIENGAVAYREVDEGEGPQGFFGPWYDDGSLTGTPQKIYVLGFAGSNDKKDWSYANAGSWCAKGIDLGRRGRMFGAAAGFVDFYVEVMDGKGGKPGLRQAIDAVADSFANTPVVVVGHSMGGALGALGATEMALRYNAAVLLRTAGAPRVFQKWGEKYGNSARDVQQGWNDDGSWSGPPGSHPEVFLWTGPDQHSSDRYSDHPRDYGLRVPPNGYVRTQRWVNYNDNVPSVPPCNTGWFHVGDGGYLLLDPVGWLSLYGWAQHQDYTPYAGGLPYANHPLGKYWDRLSTAKRNCATYNRC